jgi:transcriptional regulator with XRE-family HTH domain
MKNVSYKIIPNSLRKYRRASGFREKDVAEILGLNSASQISRWEKGVCLPRPLTMFKLAILYRTMVDGLFIDLRRTLINDLRKREEKVLGYKSKGDDDR